MIENDEQLKITKEYLLGFYQEFLNCITVDLLKYATSENSYRALAYRSMIEQLLDQIEAYKVKQI